MVGCGKADTVVDEAINPGCLYGHLIVDKAAGIVLVRLHRLTNARVRS